MISSSIHLKSVTFFIKNLLSSIRINTDTAQCVSYWTVNISDDCCLVVITLVILT